MEFDFKNWLSYLRETISLGGIEQDLIVKSRDSFSSLVSFGRGMLGTVGASSETSSSVLMSSLTSYAVFFGLSDSVTDSSV